MGRGHSQPNSVLLHICNHLSKDFSRIANTSKAGMHKPMSFSTLSKRFDAWPLQVAVIKRPAHLKFLNHLSQDSKNKDVKCKFLENLNVRLPELKNCYSPTRKRGLKCPCLIFSYKIFTLNYILFSLTQNVW